MASSRAAQVPHQSEQGDLLPLACALTGLQFAVQVVAMVTDGHQRPEIPREDLCPSPSFPGMGEYIKLMQSCWKQVTVSHLVTSCHWSGI